MWGMLAEIVIGSAVRSGVNFIASKSFDFAEKKYSDYSAKKKSNVSNNNASNKSVEENSDENVDVSEILFQIVKIINGDTQLLNNPNDKINAGYIKTKLLEINAAYKNIDLNFIEEIIKSIRFDVKIRYSLLEELKKRPQILKEKTSAITKTVGTNIGIELDDKIKSELSRQINIIKKICELHNSKKSVTEIFNQTMVFEFEIRQFIKNLSTQ